MKLKEKDLKDITVFILLFIIFGIPILSYIIDRAIKQTQRSINDFIIFVGENWVSIIAFVIAIIIIGYLIWKYVIPEGRP